MATREEADRTLAFHADAVMANPNVSLISVIQDENGEYVIEIGLVDSELVGDPASSRAGDFSLPVAPVELAIPDASGVLTRSATTIPVRKRIVGKIQVRSFTGKLRPALGGNSCGPAAGNWSGTLGARVQYKGNACIISNWHVLYGGAAKDGDPILQQARGDGGKLDDVIALNVVGVLTEHLDVALATIGKPADDYVKKGTISYGDITGTEKATDKMSVKKCGRTTEATTGEVRSTNATVRASGYPDGDRIFKDQLQMTKMSAAGDSGSIILSDKNKAVGLLFADAISDTFANKIERVVDALGVSF
ncbi:S1 family peptidase [Rhizobium sp. XQZ8]|uniref:S1 family peptidase n=1 Tax=Rhizobium populisoli TaxID=2859785 RepID=UPI001CA5AE4F|nr:S1 family peptidase [Rhizobium populisoli]MBW6421665.1 S1 family peptidase [Rhizobium populisoli]